VARLRKTKVEVENEFATLVESVDRSQATNSPKSDLIAQIQEAEIRTAVSEITVEVISKKLSDLNVEISKALSGLSEKMTKEVQLLASLKEAVALESKELQRLHNVDVAAIALDQLVADYRQKKCEYDAEAAAMEQALSRQKDERQQEEADYAEALRKARARETEDYEYTKNLERKKIQDSYEEERRIREKKNRESQELLEKGWKEREASLKLREEEFLALKKETEQFPSRIAAECAKSSKDAAKETEAKFSQEMERLKRDLTVEKQLSELKIKQLHESLAASQAQIHSLQTQLEDAKRQVQDIAVKAIEGASGAKALNHINQIAIEQAKNRAQS